MVDIAITQAARHRRHHAAGQLRFEAERTEKGEVHIWLEERWTGRGAVGGRSASPRLIGGHHDN
jgi:hypothetical protein